MRSPRLAPWASSFVPVPAPFHERLPAGRLHMRKDYHEPCRKNQRPFVVTRYRAQADGQLVPEMPGWCVEGKRGACRLRIDHFRERKTGPCFALAVLVCAVHRLGFTLYPPGHVPYGRVAVAPLGVGGELVREPAQAGCSAPVAWGLTIFRAAVEAAEGAAWPRTNVPGEPRRWWRTQGRHLHLGARLVAVAGSVRQRQREQVAQILGVALLGLVGAADVFATGGYRERGRAIVQVLEEVERTERVGDRLLTAGGAMGLWGAPSRWDPGGGPFRPTLRALLRAGRG